MLCERRRRGAKDVVAAVFEFVGEMAVNCAGACAFDLRISGVFEHVLRITTVPKSGGMTPGMSLEGKTVSGLSIFTAAEADVCT